MRLFLLGAAAVMLTFSGCGKSGSDGPKKNEQKTVAPFDCSTFEKRVYECSAEFSAAYSRTESATRVRGNTPEEKAAAIVNVLEMVKKLEGQNACSNIPVWGNLAGKDPKWQERYNKCKADAPCAEWGKCVADALGQPLTL